MLLLDEPTSALDPFSTEAVEELMRNLSPALTLIVVTHNLAQARRVSHMTMFLFEGKLIEHGPTEEIFERPRARRLPSATSAARSGELPPGGAGGEES